MFKKAMKYQIYAKVWHVVGCSIACILLLIWHACILLLIWHACILLLIWHACILLLIWHAQGCCSALKHMPLFGIWFDVLRHTTLTLMFYSMYPPPHMSYSMYPPLHVFGIWCATTYDTHANLLACVRGCCSQPNHMPWFIWNKSREIHGKLENQHMIWVKPKPWTLINCPQVVPEWQILVNFLVNKI